MSWFSIFSKRKIDENILDLYMNIELLIQDTDRIFQEYFSHLFSSGYYDANRRDKKFYSIQKVSNFFKRLKEDYAYCYTLRKNRTHYNFSKTAKSIGEKQEIQRELKKILSILEKIHSKADALNKSRIKDNDFSELVRYLEEFIASEKVLKNIKEKDEHMICGVIKEILKESEQNERGKMWLISQKDKKTRLFFSQGLSISDIKYLELVPLLELNGLAKRSLFINELHKDEILPILHYNLDIGGRNIHVIPRNLKEKVKPYLLAN